MATKAKFLVFGTATKCGVHLIGAGSTILLGTFKLPREAFKRCEEFWIAVAKSIGTYGKHTKATFLATHPVPWAPGSLKPTTLKETTRIMKPTAAKVRKVARKIQRHAAVEKIIEGAKVGMGLKNLPKQGKMIEMTKSKAKAKHFGRRGSDARVAALTA